jgi:signal transduction histidine kinase
VNLETLIESNINLLKLQNRNIEYQISVDTVHPFYTDEFRLSVIIDNLLSNAVKYQNPEEHHPHVHIHARVTDEEAIIGIEDNGIGIIKEHLDNVFNIFFRTNNHLKREGLGIGLFIVKEALTKMGGNIAVQSVVNKGTSFHIILPNQRKKVLTHQ